jgi:hypothetical protein
MLLPFKLPRGRDNESTFQPSLRSPVVLTGEEVQCEAVRSGRECRRGCTICKAVVMLLVCTIDSSPVDSLCAHFAALDSPMG